MVDTRDIAARLHAIADDLARAGAGDWVDAHYRDDDVRSSDQIALICGVSSDTIRRRAEASLAEGFPLGVQRCGVWMLSLRRVLDWIERHQGRHARLVAEDRARENADLRLKPQKVPENVG
jgi:hypothetical protein